MEENLSLDHDWPQRLRVYIEQEYGIPVAVERLAGMSLSGVWRARFDTISVIIKASPLAAETYFYEQIAPSLRTAGIPIPNLYLSLHEPDRHWVVIEDIPEPLPETRADAWQPDQRIITILTRLHATTRAQPPDLPAPPPRPWNDEVTRAALSCLPATDSVTLRPLLVHLQAESQPLYTPWCWISGDPNPRNWGLRPDGSPVLFDWELFSPGIPATDLAIIVPGLGTIADYASVAVAYLASWSGHEALPWDADCLTHLIAVAKVATVVQLLHGHVTGSATVNDDLLVWLTRTLPTWVKEIHGAVTAACMDQRSAGMDP